MMFDLNISKANGCMVRFRCACKGYNQLESGPPLYPERFRVGYLCDRHWVWFQDCAQHALRYIPKGSSVYV